MADQRYRLMDHCGKALALCVREVPVISALLMLVYAVKAIIVVLNINMLQRLFDGIQDCLEGKKEVRDVYVLVGMVLAYMVMQHVMNAASNVFQSYYINTCIERVTYKLHQEVEKVPAIFFEDAARLDLIDKAKKGAEGMSIFTKNLIYILFYDMVYLVSMIYYLVSLRPLLAFVCLFVFIPNFLSHIVRIKIFDKMEDLSVRPWRKKEHFEQCIVSREYHKETRLFGAVGFFKSKYLDALEDLKLIKYEACKKNGLIDLGLSLTMVVSYIGILIVLMDSLLKDFVTVGAFAAVYAALDEFFLQMDCILQYDLGNVTGEFGKIKNHFKFIEMAKEESRAKKGKEQIGGFTCARMESLSFAYPNGEDVLKDIDFSIHRGETIAVVGENGSGKSTFSKVLSGLYQPQKGRYLINGRDSSGIDTDSVFTNVSVVFQNFMRYQMSLRENIIFSDVKDDEVDRRLRGILAEVGLGDKADGLGLDAVLSREFGNTDLSGGEWQRLAIARAVNKAHDVLILDEPTSAIDPNDETRLYELFYELARDKTSVIITHRIGAASKADRIIVFQDGAIVQEGTYDDLVSREGEFKRLYEAQARWYH